MTLNKTVTVQKEFLNPLYSMQDQGLETKINVSIVVFQVTINKNTNYGPEKNRRPFWIY